MLSPYTVTIYTKQDNPYNVIPDAPIEIRERLANGTSGSLSTIYEDQEGLIPITQIGAKANSNGQFTFYAEAAQYNAVYESQTVPVDVGLTADTLPSAIINDLSQTYNFDTLAEAVAADFLVEGKVLALKERTSGNGGGAIWGCVDINTVTPNGFDIVACTGNVALALKLRVQGRVDPVSFGCIPDGATDCSGAMQAIYNNPEATHVHFEKLGTYKFLSSSDCTRDITITFAEGTNVDCTDAGFTGGYWSKFTGAFPQIENLGVNASKGDRKITFASPPSLNTGDVLCIWNPTNSSWSGFRTSYFAGEWCRVVDVSGSVVTIAAPLYDNYTTADVNVYRLNGVNVNITDIDIDGSASDSLIDVEYGIDCLIRGIKSKHSNNSIILVSRSYNTQINPVDIFNAGDGGDDYGISIANCQTLRVNGGNIYSRRHAITIGGGAGPGATTCRDIKIIGSTISNDIDSQVFAADFHGNTEDSQYIDCTIYGGATWQGKNNGYVNCDITNFDEGVCIIGAEILGGDHYAIGCRFKTTVDPSASGRGVVDVGGNNAALTVNTEESANLMLKGCTLNGENLSGNTNILTMEITGSTVPVNIDIDELTINCDVKLSSILRTFVNSGTANSNYIIVDNLLDKRGNQNGVLLCNHSGSSYTDFEHRLQKQTGSEELTTSTSASVVVGTDVVYKWVYPREPVIVSGRNGRGYFGNRIGIPFADPTSTTGHRPAMASDDATNFSAALTFDLTWQAEISET